MESQVGALGMNARKRGWLVRKAFGATFAAKSSRIAAKSCPVSGGGSASKRVSSAGVPVWPSAC